MEITNLPSSVIYSNKNAGLLRNCETVFMTVSGSTMSPQQATLSHKDLRAQSSTCNQPGLQSPFGVYFILQLARTAV